MYNGGTKHLFPEYRTRGKLRNALRSLDVSTFFTVIILPVFCMETDPDPVWTGMAAGGGVRYDIFYREIFSEALPNQISDLPGKLGSIGMADDETVGAEVVAKVGHLLHKVLHRLDASFLLAAGDHLALSGHVDDGTDSDERPHGGGKTAYTAAAAEKLEVIGEEIHCEPVHFVPGPFQDLGQALSCLEQIADFTGDGITDRSDAFGVYLVEIAPGVFGFELRHSMVHGIESIGHGTREVDVEDVIAGGEFGFEIFHVPFGRNGACSREDAAAEKVVEFPGVEFVEIDVRVDGLGVYAVGHADQAVAVFLCDCGGDVGIGVGEKGEHIGHGF